MVVVKYKSSMNLFCYTKTQSIALVQLARLVLIDSIL